MKLKQWRALWAVLPLRAAWVLGFAAWQLTAGAASAEYPEVDPADIFTPAELVIRLERHGCFGVCPIYAVTLDGTGRVEFTGKQYTRIRGSATATIDPVVVRRLAREFLKANFLRADARYDGMHYLFERAQGLFFFNSKVFDKAGITLHLKLGRREHRVYLYHNVPPELGVLPAQVDEAAGTQQWIAGLRVLQPQHDDYDLAQAALRRMNDEDEEVRYQALIELTEMQIVDAADAAKRALADTSPRVRTLAVDKLGDAPGTIFNGVRTPNATETIIPMLHDAVPEVRAVAASRVAQQRDVRAIAPLRAMLRDAEERPLAAAAAALGTFGAAARSAQPDLMPLLRRRETHVRMNAAIALLAIGAPPTLAIDALMRSVRDPNEYRRYEVVRALRDLGPLARPATRVLATALNDAREDTRNNACLALTALSSKEASRALSTHGRACKPELAYDEARMRFPDE